MYDTASTPSLPVPTFIPKALTTVAAALVIFLAGLVTVISTFQSRYENRIYPGISVAGVDLSGKTAEEAIVLLAGQYQYPVNGKIAFQDGGGAWVAAPVELGLRFDYATTVMNAYQLGRRGSSMERLNEQLRLWQHGTDLPLVVVYDENLAYHFLEKLAGIVNRETIEASLEIHGATVSAQPGQVGRTLDIPATLALLPAHLLSLTDGIVPMVIHEHPPMILDATAQAELARKILSVPLIIKNPDVREGNPENWRYSPDEMSRMLVIQRSNTGNGVENYEIVLRHDELEEFLTGLAPSLVVEPEDARFIFNDDTRQLEVLKPHVVGRELDIPGTIERINQVVTAGEHEAELVYTYKYPAVVTDKSAADYGITELVASQISYFYGSSSSRIQNIATAAARFHGVMVPPGATFSMGAVLGDVSLDTGYAEALIIYGDRTIKGVGGGVCQVSTTLFRTAFFGGYKINERYAHAYRVTYYELNASGGINTNLAGLDATVYTPYVDFKFTNDTPYWLLMETYTNAAARTLTWKFYSTSDGRSVDWKTTGLQNRTPPPKPLYQENPQLAPGVVKQVDWEVEGADVTVTRVVMRGTETLHQDVFRTHYQPWRSVYEYGPGTEGMPPADPEE